MFLHIFDYSLWRAQKRDAPAHLTVELSGDSLSAKFIKTTVGNNLRCGNVVTKVIVDYHVMKMRKLSVYDAKY